RGSGEAARRGFLDCLALARHVGDQFIVAEALAGLSTQSALDGRHLDAARQAGAAAVINEQIGAPPWESLAAIHEHALTATRDALGPEAVAALEGEGRRLSATDAAAGSRRFVRSGAPAVAPDTARQP
ncbi:MAG TPA: hypothetical protein VFZ00_25090, partial [Solirubrobacter sp.]|nr:hypothetical protein [Solirubrobacter sp.]